MEKPQQLVELENALRKQEEDTVKAAMLGKALLEENNELQLRIDELINQHGLAAEEKQQLISSLQARCDIHTSTETWYQEEISNLRLQLQSAKQSISHQLEEQKKVEINSYRKQMESLQLDLEHCKGVEEELHQRVKELESLLQSHLDRTQMHSVSASFDSEEMAAAQLELHTLRMDLLELQTKNIDLAGQVKQLHQERDTLKSRLSAYKMEVDELQCQITCYHNHLEEVRQEAGRMQAQLDDAKVEGQHHSKKGNSLFSELEDRRLEVEKKMVTLQVQCQQLKEKYELEKQQNQKYRMQAAMALHMTSQKHDDPHVQRLHSQLKEAHAEIRTLTEQLQKLETDKSAVLDMQEFSRFLSEVEDKSYVEFLLTVIQTEKENTAKANSELQTKSLQYLDMSNQNAELIRQIKHLEAEQGKLQAALLKVQLQKEELLLKYEPEKVKGKKPQRRVVEKIDMGGIQPQLAENVSFSLSTSRLNDILKSMSSVSSDSHLSTALKPVNVSENASEGSKAASSTERASNNYGFGITNKMAATKQMKLRDRVFVHDNYENTFLEGKENLGNMGCGPLYGHKVSIADDVKVIESNGEEKSISLSNGVDKSVANRKKATVPATNVKQISASEAPELQCKTQ